MGVKGLNWNLYILFAVCKGQLQNPDSGVEENWRNNTQFHRVPTRRKFVGWAVQTFVSIFPGKTGVNWLVSFGKVLQTCSLSLSVMEKAVFCCYVVLWGDSLWVKKWSSIFQVKTLYSDAQLLPLLFNPLSPTSDQDRISPYSINTISSRQLTRIKKNIN